jgi:hypothetical protein
MPNTNIPPGLTVFKINEHSKMCHNCLHLHFLTYFRHWMPNIYCEPIKQFIVSVNWIGLLPAARWCHSPSQLLMTLSIMWQREVTFRHSGCPLLLLLFSWTSVTSHGCTTAYLAYYHPIWTFQVRPLDASAPADVSRTPCLHVCRRIPHSSSGSWNFMGGEMKPNFA